NNSHSEGKRLVMRSQSNYARQHVTLILALASLIGAAALISWPTRHASAQGAGASWSFTGSLNVGRWRHTATLLQDGRVLVAGGYSECCPPTSFAGFLKSAEVYDPTTGTWTVTGSLSVAHANHAAVTLSNGKVLVVGAGINVQGGGKICELYDPAT